MALAKKEDVMNLLGESPIFKRFNILLQTKINVSENGTVSLAPKQKGKDRFVRNPQPIVHQYRLRERKAPEAAQRHVARQIRIKV